MDTLIETMNAGGDQALRFAWPMFWQSSLLIGLLFALEWALRRKVRASVRYTLWLTVVVKLLLPPSLALPTGVGWWLRPAAPTVHQTSVVVSYGPGRASGLSPDRAAVPEPPARTGLSAAALGLVGWCFVSLGLLAWMLARWRALARRTQQAGTAPQWLEQLLAETRRAAGVRGRMRLRLLDEPVSPAVCGLLRPVILLPRLLSEQLPSAQLRTVLLHELVHLRRRDVWVNCAQSLAQLAYWWHPLLWMANARIRRLREEAVDDAVMHALRDEAEAYAPTLLEVAKLALRRPLASLGLVGILESHNSLRQRIQRLLDFCPTRKSGLTLGSALWVVAFGALALPMGKAPKPDDAPTTFSSESSPLPDPQLNNSKAVDATPAATPTTANDASPQIHIGSKFIEVPVGAMANFWQSVGTPDPARSGNTNWSTILTPAQAQAALKAVEAIPRADLLSESSLVTLDGRQAQIQVVDIKTIVTSINPRALTPPGVNPNPTNANDTNALYLTQTLPFGPTLDVIPHLGSDERSVRMTLIPSLTEFLGYEPPTNPVTIYVGGLKQKATVPLPHFRVRQVTNTADVLDGYTLVIGNGIAENVIEMKDKVPVLGDVPVLGRLFRSESRSLEKKQLLVLVTPSLIDRAGNLFHRQDQPPPASAEVSGRQH